MSKTTSATNNSSFQNSPNPIQYGNRAYGLVENIRNDLEVYGLEPEQISIDVNVESTEDSLEIEYRVETLGWYDDDGELGLGKDTISFNNSYSIESSTEVPENGIEDLLEDNFDNSAIRANGDIIQKSLSPDYPAF